MSFRSGFVALIGKPNSGKSTLLNALLGEKISIVTPKIQTTRHRIKGILTGENYQIVFSDTPGVIDSKYKLHESMMKSVTESLEDADVIVVLIDPTEPETAIGEIASLLKTSNLPKVIAINKADAIVQEKIKTIENNTRSIFTGNEVLTISALKKENLDALLDAILKHLPQQNAFYSGEELTDRSERFIVSELIREKIFQEFRKEVPYSSEVIIQNWKEEKEVLNIRAEIIVERESQKAILLGKGGQAIKNLGIKSRKDIENFLGRKIFLGLTVKVNPNWRNNANQLKNFGYHKL